MNVVEATPYQIRKLGYEHNWAEDTINRMVEYDSRTLIFYDEDEYPICLVGLTLQWKGVATAWTIMEPRAKNYAPTLTRTMKRKLHEYMEKLNLWRVHATTPYGNEQIDRWMRLLGFREEAIMLYFFPDMTHATAWALFRGVGGPENVTT